MAWRLAVETSGRAADGADLSPVARVAVNNAGRAELEVTELDGDAARVDQAFAPTAK